jgi:peptidoglycan hydrolase-like protein with peptidoglycan-binding domain
MKPVFAALLLAPLLFAATATKSKSASSTASSKAKTTSHSTHSSKKARHTARKRRPARRPSYQTQPTADRYKDIQQALADKGYFKGDVTGKWGPDSSDALQRFQTDNKLPNDGKINSLSIIQLGLGPKRDPITPVATPPVTPVVPTSPSPSAPTISDPPTEAPPSPAPAQQ